MRTHTRRNPGRVARKLVGVEEAHEDEHHVHDEEVVRVRKEPIPARKTRNLGCCAHPAVALDSGVCSVAAGTVEYAIAT